MPPKRQSQDPSLKSEEVTADTSSRRLNGSKTKPTSKRAASDNASGKDRAPRKPAARKPASRSDATAAKKAKRTTKKERDAAAAMQTSTKATSKRKPKPPAGSARAAFAVKEEDVSSEEEDDGCARVYDSLPSIGDEVAIKCPPDPPFPEGWYAAVVIDVIEHRVEGKPPSSKAKGKAAKVVKDFTLQVEWDGGGVEDLRNPEWRMKVDAPDKQGKISHRDTKLRPYFKYWVTRLNAMDEAEKKLGRTRAGKNLRIDPNQKVEWIQCADPNCGKWRALPPYMKSSAILETCDNRWFCVLNSWDEAIASCGAPQETGYMPSSSTT